MLLKNTHKAVIGAILFGLCAGLVTSITMVQNMPSTRQYLADFVHTRMHNSAQCDFNCTVTSCNLFTLTVICDDVRITPLQQEDWHWSCRTLTMRFSWIALLSLQKLVAAVELQDAQFYSAADQHTLAIAGHLAHFLPGAMVMPWRIKTLKVDNASFTVVNHELGLKGFIEYAGISKRVGSSLKVAWYLKNGSLEQHGRMLVKHFAGTLHGTISRNAGKNLTLNAQTFIRVLPPTHDLAFIQATLTDDTWQISAHNQDNSIVTTLYQTQPGVMIDTALTSDLFAHFIPAALTELYKDTLSIHAHYANGAIQGTASLATFPLACQWRYQDNTCTLDLTNTNTLSAAAYLPHCVIPHALKIHGTCTPKQAALSWIIPIINPQEKTCLNNTGSLDWHNNIITASGTIGHYTIALQGTNSPTFALNKGTCTNRHNGLCTTATAQWKDNHCAFKATLPYNECRRWFPEKLQELLPGNGSLTITGTLGWPESILTLSTHNGYIMFGKAYNMCTGLKAIARINHQTHAMSIENIDCTLDKGQVRCPQAQLTFDQSWHLLHAHIPCTFQQCLINWNKNICICSGNLLFAYQPSHPTIQATVLIEKAALSSALIAQLRQKNTLVYTIAQLPLTADISIETKKPLHIQLPSIIADAQAQLHIEGTTLAHRISGIINLHDGTMKFPYKDLKIISGTIHLDPDQIDNSLIELIAKTTIGHHAITLQILGTLNNPVMRLSSLPALAEQQVRALLIAGTSDTELSAAIPILVTEQLKRIIIDTQQPIQQSGLARALKPLEHVKLIPRFVDARGNAGLYGGIELDIDERLQAKVQKNLEEAQDVSFEVDYRMSDEVSLKAFKDEHGKMGGQVNVRFKW